jgi:hypothetical protein
VNFNVLLSKYIVHLLVKIIKDFDKVTHADPWYLLHDLCIVEQSCMNATYLSEYKECCI